MSHETEIISYEKISNGQFVIIIHCCGEHEHRHTVGGEVMADAEKLKSSIEFARDLAASNHATMLKTEEHLKGIVGSKKQHG